MKREIKNMLRLNHPFVISLLEVVLTDQHLVLCLEMAQGGELFSLVARKQILDEDEARHFFQQVVLGLEYLHSHGIFHRDLKLENILLDSDQGRLWVADLGYSKSTQDSHPHSTVGTPAYIAPEILARGQYDGRQVDIWSLGVILFVMLAGRYPFEDPAQPRNMRRTMQRSESVV